MSCPRMVKYYDEHIAEVLKINQCSSSASFKGAVVDTGAARSCIGIKQANAYTAQIGYKPQIFKSNYKCKFGDIVLPSKDKEQKSHARNVQVIKDIQSRYEPCATMERKQLRFQLGSISTNDLIFNREIVMDIVKINNYQVLHIIDSDTHFGEAEILQSPDVENFWDALLKCWVLIYAGQPDVFFMDQGSVSTSAKWKELSNQNGVALKFSGVEHHNGIGLVEHYHAPLRSIFLKIEMECLGMDKRLVLKNAVKQ
eukprot:IDg14049t1